MSLVRHMISMDVLEKIKKKDEIVKIPEREMESNM